MTHTDAWLAESFGGYAPAIARVGTAARARRGSWAAPPRRARKPRS